MKKLAVLLILVFCVAAMSFADSAGGDKPVFKNLKVLPKNTTKEQLDSVMNHFTTSLNVKCNFCHVQLKDEKKSWDFPSDEKHHKQVAREMMKMTAALNKKYFDVKSRDGWQSNVYVTCFTCHNGKPEPAVFPPATQKPN
jgi:hypothetical protein